MTDYIEIRRDLLDRLPDEDAYREAGRIVDQAKAAASAYQDEIAARLATAHGPSAAARELGVSHTLITKRTTRHGKRTTMTTTTGYGSWYNHTGFNVSVEADIADFVNGGETEWHERMEEAGKFEDMAIDYRAAINAKLPNGVVLTGNEFIGPYYEADRDFDGYPKGEDGELDIAAIIEPVDLTAILDKHDVDNA